MLSSNWTSPSCCSVSIQQGGFDLNSHNLQLTGSLYVNDGGELTVNSGAGLYLDNGTQVHVNDGGRLAVIGTSSVPALISRVGTGSYGLTVDQGGTIAASDAIFEYMDAYGVNVTAGALVDPSYSFAGCTFRNGASGGSLIVLNNEQLLSIPNAVFPANTWGGNKNVNKYMNTGGVNLVNASGAFSGSSFEHDPYARVNWNTETPSIQVSHSSLTFNDTALTMMDIQSFSISNPGSGSLIGRIVAPDDFSITLDRDTVTGNGEKALQDIRNTEFNFIVAPGSSISLQVSFNPTLPQSYNSSLQIIHNAGSATQTVQLIGTGIGPKLALDPDQIVKGILPEGSHTEVLQISNSGNAALSYYATIEYGGRDRSVILQESFESATFPPLNWIISDMAGSEGNWLRSQGTAHPSGFTAQNGLYLAYFNSYNAHSGHNTMLQTGYLDFTAYSSVSLSFWMFHEGGYPSSQDRVQIMGYNNQIYSNVGDPVIRPQAPYGEWRQHTISLNQYAGLNYVKIAFLGISEYGNDIHIDNVEITGSNPPTGWVFLDGQGSSASGYLAPGGSNPHSVSLYTYGMEPGIYQAAINVATNDPIDPVKIIPIEVSVGAPAISVSPSSLTFGNQIVGTEAVQSFSITATGDLHLNGTISVPTGYSVESSTRDQSVSSVFGSAVNRWSSTLEYLLAPGETQIYHVRFIPSLMQNYPGQVNISSDLLSDQLIQLSGTGANVPTVLTLAATAITSSSATLNAQITSTGNLSIWGRGFRYGTDPDPITNGNDYMVASSNNTYSAFPTGFANGQQIYYCAFAYNELGWDYGDVLSFTTLGPSVSVSVTSLPDFGTVRITQSSLPQSFTLAGNDLSSQVTLTAPDGFRIALGSRRQEDRSPGNQLVIDPVGGVIPSTQILVYFEPNDTGVYEGNLTITSAEVSAQTVEVSGTGIDLAVVSISAITDVAQTEATSGGFVSTDGSAAVTSRGVCWSEAPQPSLMDSHTENGAGTGGFVSVMSGLTPGTLYYVRAYATNQAGTAYSDESFFTTASIPVVSASAEELPGFGNVTLGQSSAIQTFIVAGSALTGPLHIAAPDGFQISTDDRDAQRTFGSLLDLSPVSGSVYETILVRFIPGSGGDYEDAITISSPGAVNVTVSVLGRGVSLPTVQTAVVTEITNTTAVTGGNILSDGWMDILACGVCWSSSPYPNLDGEHSSNSDLTGEFIDVLSGLTPNTTYYVRAYATNGVGTTYGYQRVFSTTALAPGIPQNLSLLRQTSGILLAWDPVPNAGSYNIYRSQDPQSLDWGLPVANTVTPSWVDSSGGDGYFYRVTALSE